MARPKEEDLGDDFSYILRMADTDMDGQKTLATALTAVRVLVHEPPSRFARTPDSTLLHSPATSRLMNKKHSVLPLKAMQKPSLFGCLTDNVTLKPVMNYTSQANK